MAANDRVNELVLSSEDQVNFYVIDGNLRINSGITPYDFATNFSSFSNFDLNFDYNNQPNYNGSNTATYDDNALRLTRHARNQFGGAYFKEAFTSSADITIKFTIDWHSTQWDGANGMGVFLFDGATTDQEFRFGGFGNSVGMLQFNQPDGVTNMYLGVALHSYQYNLIAVYNTARTGSFGSGNIKQEYLRNTSGLTDHTFITGERDIEIRIFDDNGTRKVEVHVSNVKGGTLYKTLETDFINVAPETLKLGFSATTGGRYTDHYIRELSINVTPYMIYPSDGGTTTPKVVDADIAIEEPLDVNEKITSAEIQISQNYINGEDSLSVANLPSGVSASFDTATGKLTIDATGASGGGLSYTDMNVILQRVSYANSSATPTIGLRKLDWTVFSTGGQASTTNNIILSGVTP